MTDFPKKWRVARTNTALRDIFTMKLGISPVTAQILVNRGITTLDEARAFMSPAPDMLHNPLLMKDMDKAVERLALAASRGERVRIFGDYDVDGITSTTVLVKVFEQLGVKADYYIPDRLTEGYGMNREAVKKAGSDGVSVIVTVDSGISALEEVELAHALGIDVIITDHHVPPAKVPEALAVVNPKQAECPYPFKDLAGVGVAYKLAQALLGDGHPLLEGLSEIVCLGTVADIVPLKGENRILVKRGLALMSRTRSAGLRALMKNCGLSYEEISSRQVAFQIAPRLNAAGRLGDAGVGVKLLLSEDDAEAARLAAQLCTVNEERQAVEAAIYREALEFIEQGSVNLETDRIIVLAREGWHLGVIGIVASKLVQDFYRPVVLLSIDGDVAKGSTRSIPPFNIHDALVNTEEYLEKFGGHHQAAGLTIKTANIQGFTQAVNSYADSLLTEDDLVPELFIDSEVALPDLTESLYRQLQQLAPYGCENSAPVLVCRQNSIMECRAVGAEGSHLKLRIRDNSFVFDAIGFNLGGRCEALSEAEDYDFVFALEKNEWNGRANLQLNVKDLRVSSADTFSAEGSEEEQLSFVDQLFQNAAQYLIDDYYRDIGEKDEFFTKVAGVTFDNRQEIVARLSEGERLILVRETDNSYDKNAVRVETVSGEQIGYLNAGLARHFAPLLDKGEQYLVHVTQVTGGQERSCGVNILIQKIMDETGEESKLRHKTLREELGGLPDSELMDRIRQAILGEKPYRSKQLEALDLLFEGYSTLAVFGTGRGKSAVFQSKAAFMALRRQELTVIMYPLRALVNDQYESMTARLGELGLRIYRGSGSLAAGERAALFEALEQGEIDVLLTTPEFLHHHLGKLQGMSKKTGFFVVDESHHIGLSTHRPSYKRLGELATSLGGPVVLAVTATANDEVADEIIDLLDIEKVVIDPHVRTNLQVIDKRDWADKNDYLRQIVGTGSKTIIYVNSRLQAVELAAMLRESLPRMAGHIVFYHAGLSSQQRTSIESMFRGGEVTAVISTSAFGEGIDIPDVKHVIVYHLNFNFTEFNQQCGRCGRDGQTAHVHLLCGRRDMAINRFILEAASPDRDNLAKLYVALRELAKVSNPITASNDEIVKKLISAGVKSARPGLVSAGLGVLAELELIHRESLGRERQIFLLPAPERKLSLENSLRYLEGEEERKAFDDFQQYFFQALPEELLGLINSPIYPEKYLERESLSIGTQSVI